MIFYFSGTGNSKWVAEEMARKTKDMAVDIIGLNQVPDLENEKQIGLVFPIYAWGAAEPMLAFAKELNTGNVYTFGICTCGADAGLAMKKLSKSFKLESCYSVLLPSNYIVGADVENDITINEKLDRAKVELAKIEYEVINKARVYRVSEGSLAFVKSNFITAAFNKFARTTKPFHADDNCIACGLCEAECPIKTIKIVNAKPTWGEKCYQCMKCINHCPEHAIQYGKKTANRGRYRMNV